MLLFKYLSPGGAEKVLERPGEIALRFGLPRTYNDPYELFLQTDRPIETEEMRAFFDYYLGEVIEAPVTCFSRCPDSVVMWAHYGREGEGICLSFDEDELVDQFLLAFIDDVKYADDPAMIDYESLEWAYVTGKRRHTLNLIEKANRAAFFMKRSDWQYEKERRMIVLNDDVYEENGMLISRLQSKALRHIILGANVAPVLKGLCESRAAETDIPLIQQRIGRRSYQPFFQGIKTGTLIWNETAFEKSPWVCKKCHEPVSGLKFGLCEWCSIRDETRREEPAQSMLLSSLTYGYDKGLPLRFAGLEPKGRLVKEQGGN